MNYIRPQNLKDTKKILAQVKVTSKLKEPELIRRILSLVGLLTISRIGIYIPVSSQIDTMAFFETLGFSGGLMGYEDTFFGASLSMSVFSHLVSSQISMRL